MPIALPLAIEALALAPQSIDAAGLRKVFQKLPRILD
jgi:hypothetical protein